MSTLQDYDINQYIFTRIDHHSDNEIYIGVHKTLPNTCYIFKYNNSASTVGKEAQILNYLKDKVSPRIPVVCYHNIGKNISPSGKIYNDLIIMTRIKGEVLGVDNNIKHKSIQYKKQVLISLIRLVGELHSHNIIYGDTYNGNVIIDDSEIFLIDFDKAFFSNQVPEYFSQKIIERPITSDIFCIQSLITDIFPSYNLKDSHTRNLSDLLTLINDLN